MKPDDMLEELTDKGEKLKNELMELEQMFNIKKEQYLKIQGAIEALEALDPSVPPTITPHPKD
jgi:chaperonin cofactor prefoldin